jgi:hypothetical protein
MTDKTAIINSLTAANPSLQQEITEKTNKINIL